MDDYVVYKLENRSPNRAYSKTTKITKKNERFSNKFRLNFKGFFCCSIFIDKNVLYFSAQIPFIWRLAENKGEEKKELG